MIVHKGEVDDEGEGVCDDMLHCGVHRVYMYPFKKT